MDIGKWEQAKRWLTRPVKSKTLKDYHDDSSVDGYGEGPLPTIPKTWLQTMPEIDPRMPVSSDKELAAGGRVGFKLGGNEIIAAYNKAAKLAGGNPSIEQVRAATGGKPNIYRVREILNKAGLELGKPPTTRQIDELTKNLSKQNSAVQRSSVISEYLNKANKKFTISDAGRTPEARAKAAETLKAKEKPRLDQPRKTPEDILERERYKRREDAKRDPKKIKRKISKELTETTLDVHHPFPKREKETLRRLMALDQDANRAGVVREIEEARNKLMREQNILVNAPAKNRRRLEQINAEMKRLRASLRKTPYGGFLGFPVSGSRGKITWIGYDKAKSLAGLKEGEKLLDKDFAKATKKQAAKMIELGTGSVKFAFSEYDKAPKATKIKIGMALGCKVAAGMGEGGRISFAAGSAGLNDCVKSKIRANPNGALGLVAEQVPETRGTISKIFKAAVEGAAATGRAIASIPGAKTAGKYLARGVSTAGSPLAAVGFIGADIKEELKKGKAKSDIAMDPEKGLMMLLPEGTKQLVKTMGGKEALGRILSLGKYGRMMTPAGLGYTGASAAYQYGKWAKKEIERIKKMTPEEKEAYIAEQEESMGVGAKSGGLMSLTTTVASPKGPESTGLDYGMYYDKKIMERK